MAMSDAIEKREWTLEEWLNTELEPRYEFEDGRLIPMAAPTKRHQDIVLLMGYEMRRFCRANRLGTVAMGIDVVLSPRRGYIPDLVFVRREREEQVLTPQGKVIGVPDLVVEVVSPGGHVRDAVRKLRTYQEAGVPWYWLIEAETLAIQELQLTPEGYLVRSTADAGEVFRPAALPGFEINLQELLED
ncbi:MAG: Uma2 family endonuclease [Fimbriimonadales bacterium]|nr:Uma2 family endonuclease [Fimbriimonadales bacterium]